MPIFYSILTQKGNKMKYLLIVVMVVGLAYSGGIVDLTSGPTATEELSNQTMGERNALNKALGYLDFTSFSRSGLIDQLEYNGFSNSEAVYAVDHCGADWNEQAALKAQGYLDFTSFSRSGLIDQLMYNGFTRSQAEYGVTAVGY